MSNRLSNWFRSLLASDGPQKAQFNVADPTAVGDTIRAITIALAPGDDISPISDVSVYWTDSQQKVFEKKFQNDNDATSVMESMKHDLSEAEKLTTDKRMPEATALMKSLLQTYQAHSDQIAETNNPVVTTTEASLTKEAKAKVKNVFQTIEFDNPQDLIEYQEKMKAMSPQKSDTALPGMQQPGAAPEGENQDLPGSVSYKDLAKQEKDQAKDVSKRIETEVKEQVKSQMDKKVATLFTEKDAELVHAMRGVGRTWEEVRDYMEKTLKYEKASVAAYLDEMKTKEDGDPKPEFEAPKEKPEDLKGPKPSPEELTPPSVHDKLLDEVKPKEEVVPPAPKPEDVEIPKMESSVKEIAKVETAEIKKVALDPEDAPGAASKPGAPPIPPEGEEPAAEAPAPGPAKPDLAPFVDGSPKPGDHVYASHDYENPNSGGFEGTLVSTYKEKGGEMAVVQDDATHQLEEVPLHRVTKAKQSDKIVKNAGIDPKFFEAPLEREVKLPGKKNFLLELIAAEDEQYKPEDPTTFSTINWLRQSPDTRQKVQALANASRDVNDFAFKLNDEFGDENPATNWVEVANQMMADFMPDKAPESTGPAMDDGITPPPEAPKPVEDELGIKVLDPKTRIDQILDKMNNTQDPAKKELLKNMIDRMKSAQAFRQLNKKADYSDWSNKETFEVDQNLTEDEKHLNMVKQWANESPDANALAEKLRTTLPTLPGAPDLSKVNWDELADLLWKEFNVKQAPKLDPSTTQETITAPTQVAVDPSPVASLADLKSELLKIQADVAEMEVKCPKCGENIWDYAGGGMTGAKLNKCWNCGTAFDSPEAEAAVKTAADPIPGVPVERPTQWKDNKVAPPGTDREMAQPMSAELEAAVKLVDADIAKIGEMENRLAQAKADYQKIDKGIRDQYTEPALRTGYQANIEKVATMLAATKQQLVEYGSSLIRFIEQVTKNPAKVTDTQKLEMVLKKFPEATAYLDKAVAKLEKVNEEIAIPQHEKKIVRFPKLSRLDVKADVGDSISALLDGVIADLQAFMNALGTGEEAPVAASQK